MRVYATECIHVDWTLEAIDDVCHQVRWCFFGPSVLSRKGWTYACRRRQMYWQLREMAIKLHPCQNELYNYTAFGSCKLWW